MAHGGPNGLESPGGFSTVKKALIKKKVNDAALMFDMLRRQYSLSDLARYTILLEEVIRIAENTFCFVCKFEMNEKATKAFWALKSREMLF